ncbi:MAG: tetratricopeptide repeat protein [Lactobacillaceae bacterium]|jgi:hypothetical protein|nr:tetratricopeptide repeat protein [Lactobacillaceae bacterium]
MKKRVSKAEEKSDLEVFQDRFIQEVDEELKNENLVIFWKKYGLYIVAAVVLILTATVSFETFKALHEKRNQTWSDKYAYALSLQLQGRYEDSLKTLEEIVEQKHEIYSDLAKIQISNIYFDEGDTEKAVSELENVINDKNMNEKLKDISTIKIASYKLDTAPREEIEALLKTLASTENTWTNIAKEMLAMLEIREGNYAEARKIYEEILSSPSLSDVLRFRVQDMLSVLNNE